MRTLLSFENFDAFGGTETYVLTVAQQLERLGHRASIYTPNPGTMAEFARAEGVRVVGRDQLPRDCDAVFAQDAATCYELASRYPGAPRVLVAHSRDHVLQSVPQLPDVCHAVVVLNDRVRSSVESQARHPPVTRLRQPIDIARFGAIGVARARPRRVLVSTNYVAGTRAELIEAACREAGLELDWIGTTTRPTATPERALADADIFIGLGRGVLEAMATGRAAYVYGLAGADGWVTPESYPRLEADGFGGLASDRIVDASRLAADLREWHPNMGEANRDLACAHHIARDHAIELVSLVGELGRAPGGSEVEAPSAPSPVDELARLVRLEWQMYARAMRAVLEAQQLRAEREVLMTDVERHLADAERADARVGELDRHLHDANARVVELEAAARDAGQLAERAQRQLAELHATRRYRIASLIAAPLDRLRG